MTSTTTNPSWWNKDHDSAWERTKTAFKRDWEQTKHDFGSKSARDLDQDVGDTLKQAAGKGPGDVKDAHSFDANESAFRYGSGARAQYQSSQWDDSLESNLKKDYPGDWSKDRDYVKKAYDYKAE